MSQSNIDLVKSLYDAFSRGEIAKIIGAATPEVTWRVTGDPADYPMFGERNGQEGVGNFFKMLAEMQEPIEFSPREFYAAQDKVFVIGHYEWKLRKNGKKVRSDFVHIFTLAGDKYQAFLEFNDTARFREAYHG